MKLRHLTDNTCASCGARCVEETQTSKHCNGQWFESQRFECGARITWLPNYKRQEQAMECPKSEGEIMRHDFSAQKADADARGAAAYG